MKAISGLLAIFVSLPIWFYLMYQVLERVNAGELMWFLYWIYVPATIFSSVLARLASKDA